MGLKRSIVLAGIKHCGKSTLGALLARRYGVEFIDTDRELEERFRAESGRELVTREIFRELGAEKFRKFEAAVIGALAKEEAAPRIVAFRPGQSPPDVRMPTRIAIQIPPIPRRTRGFGTAAAVHGTINVRHRGRLVNPARKKSAMLRRVQKEEKTGTKSVDKRAPSRYNR